ncbi:hypothetical protein SAZ_41505 [Streptomyces noursei ZPM]|nr:hypothetical protein SAZ_41505 [Streptomyces noursei ZPM]
MVTQIDEEDAAQVTSIVQPAAETDVGVDVRGSELAASCQASQLTATVCGPSAVLRYWA